jgi:hypothetical protein
VSALPAAPGSLTKPPAARSVLEYLAALERWCTDFKAALDELDARARVARDPGAYTADIVLAMSLWNTIDARRRQLVTKWDSGRVLEKELADIATLIWGRLSDPLGTPSAFTLPEACTLAVALCERVNSNLADDAVAGSGAAARLEPLRAALKRCRHTATVLGMPVDQIDALSADLESTVAGSNPDAISTVVARIERDVALMERDLIKEASLRAGVPAQCEELRRRYDELVALEREVQELAQRCLEKIADAPRQAIPAVAELGTPPAARSGDAPGGWGAVRREIAQYAERLGRVAAALAVARDRFAAPLQEREDLRGLLGAYRHRATDAGLAEDVPLSDRYRTAHDVLWSAPCDLAAARRLVTEYQHAVRIAVGVERAIEPQANASDRRTGEPA